MTSYLARLAEAHCVTIGTLIGKVVAKELGKEYLLVSCKNGGSRFYEQGSGLNGLGKQAEDLSIALFNLTGCDVSSLTLQSWKEIFPGTNLLRKYKAWCSVCLEAWKSNHQPIHEPLIWNFNVINVCGAHGTSLSTCCQLCGSEIPILSRKSRNGYCSYCGCWLGSQNARYSINESAQSSWDYFVVSNIGDLLISRTQLPTNYFTDFIKKLIYVAGGLNAFSRHFDIAKSTASEWRNGVHKPSLNMILKLCYSLGLNVLDLSQPFTLDNIESGKNVGSKSKPERRRIDWNYVKTTLEDIKKDYDTYTPSIREIARGLNIDKRSLYYHLPALCKEISKHHSSQLQLMKDSRIKDGCEKIREAMINAYCSCEYPSRRNIENKLPSSIILREKTFSEFWKTFSHSEQQNNT